MKHAYRRPESALVVIYDRQGRVLVMQRQDDPEFWQSVTGTLEDDELAISAALREVKEETGIDIQNAGYQLTDHQHTNQFSIRDIWQHRYPPGTPFNTEHVFSVQVAGNDHIILTEHLHYLWLDKISAMEKVWSDTNRLAIEDCVPDRFMPT